MNKTLYTAGEIARISGVSLRTIRFYDQKALLKPVSYSDAGYRYYDRQSLAVLQRILMLKYLGFSLQQIEEMLAARDRKENHFVELQFEEQKRLLLQKKTHLEEMLSIMDTMEKSRNEDKWGFLIRLLNLLTDEEKIREQYETSSNLEKRIELHSYSTSSQGWMEWVYERLGLQENQKVLELGCGTGLLWVENIRSLPRGLRLILTDRSEGMLEKTRENLSAYQELLRRQNISIEYCIMDGDDLSLEKSLYDCIIANHMLYHVKNRQDCLREIAEGLKPSGSFYCSTVGALHMQELHEIVMNFDPQIELPSSNITANFRLENAASQLKAFFAKVERMDQENDLIVDNAEAIYAYVDSYPGNASCILEQKGMEFRRCLQEKIEKEGAVYIHKSQGMFRCGKGKN